MEGHNDSIEKHGGAMLGGGKRILCKLIVNAGFSGIFMGRHILFQICNSNEMLAVESLSELTIEQ